MQGREGQLCQKMVDLGHFLDIVTGLQTNYAQLAGIPAITSINRT